MLLGASSKHLPQYVGSVKWLLGSQKLLMIESPPLSTMLRQVTFSFSIRDDMVLSIQDKGRQMYLPDALRRRLNCFTAEVLTTITDVTAGEICVLFEPQDLHIKNCCTQPTVVVDDADAMTSHAEDVDEESSLEEDTEAIRKSDSAVTTPPPAPLTLTAESPAGIGLDNPAQQPIPSPEPVSAAVSSPSPPLSLPAEPAVSAAVLEGEVMSEEPTPEPDSAVVPPPPASPTTAEPPANIGLDKSAKQSASCPDQDSAVVPAPPSPLDTHSAVVSFQPSPLLQSWRVEL